MSLFKSAFTIGSFTLLSRVFGYIRDIMVAGFIGVSALSDAFFVAFRLPNFFRTIAAEGALSAAFVPLFAQKLSSSNALKHTDNQDAYNFARNVFSFLLLFLLVLTIVAEIFMEQIMLLLAPGFINDKVRFSLAVLFARINFPYLIFISLVALLSGMLNSFGKFAVAAFAPILLNICMIVALWLLTPYVTTPAHSLAFAVVVAGILQFMFLYFSVAKTGMVMLPTWPVVNADLKLLLKRMGPGILGGGVMQINVWINTVIATMISGAVSYLYYADRLVQFPLAIIGTAMGVALLPALSCQLKEGKKQNAIVTQNKAMNFVLVFTIPAAFALAVMAELLIMVLFQRGEFTYGDTNATAAALIAYSFGLPAFALVKVFAPVFFSNGDTKTPVKIAIICLVVNVVLNLILMHPFGHVGLAVSTSISSWLNFILLVWILLKRKLYSVDVRVMKNLFIVMLAAIFMSIIVYFLQDILASYTHYIMPYASIVTKVLALFALIFIGMVVYFLLAFVLSFFVNKSFAVRSLLL